MEGSTERIRELEAEVAELRDLVCAPQGGSRRALLRLAGAAAASAVGVAAVARPAAADNGITLLGAANTTGDETRVGYTGASTTQSAFLFTTGSTGNNTSGYPAALAGWALIGSNPPNGIYGYTAHASANAIVGFAAGNGSTGVYGTAGNGVGVKADGNTGVNATGVGLGVSTVATSPTGYGVYAAGGGAGVAGMSATGYAASALWSGKANLYLQPNNDIGAPTPKTLPPLRTDEHKTGELESVAGDLWFCVAGGTPGTWRKVTGTAVAGGYHAITPTRVYDSRSQLPVQGAIVAGTSRTVGLKDGRDLTTGAVTTADLLPAGCTAVSANVTVVNTVSAGFLAVNPGGNPVVSAATVNWSASDQILNNGVMITLGAERDVTIIAGGSPGAQTDVVIDVTGYFR